MTAITSTLYPLFNTFLIFLVVVAIYAVMASQLYGDNLPERFGTFTLAALSLFQARRVNTSHFREQAV